MGKTEAGAIWLSAQRTAPYAFYQYWINVTDDDAGRCLRLLTDLARVQIEELDRARQTCPQQRDSQQVLARELTRLIHGESGLAQARQATEIFFGAEISELSDNDLRAIFADVPSREIPRAQLQQGLPVIDVLVATGLCHSKSDARRSLQQGGIYVNNRRVEGLDVLLTPAHLASESMIVLRSGKKNYALLRTI
jgi:tyrosyl-tRNA synthetase